MFAQGREVGIGLGPGGIKEGVLRPSFHHDGPTWSGFSSAASWTRHHEVDGGGLALPPAPGGKSGKVSLGSGCWCGSLVWELVTGALQGVAWPRDSAPASAPEFLLG